MVVGARGLDSKSNNNYGGAELSGNVHVGSELFIEGSSRDHDRLRDGDDHVALVLTLRGAAQSRGCGSSS